MNVGKAADVLDIHHLVIKIHIYIVAVALKGLYLGVAKELLKHCSSAPTRMNFAVLVNRIFIEKYDYARLAVYKTPHVSLIVAEVGLVAVPCLVNIDVCAILQSHILQCWQEHVEHDCALVLPVEQVLPAGVPVHVRIPVLGLTVSGGSHDVTVEYHERQQCGCYACAGDQLLKYLLAVLVNRGGDNPSGTVRILNQ